MSPALGKHINLGNNGPAGNSLTWGKSSNELFVYAGKLLRLDLNSKKIEPISELGIVGRTNENSGLVLVGKIGGQWGYYKYDYSSAKVELLRSFTTTESTNFHIANNHMFFYTAPASPTPPPCTGYCWPLPLPGNPGSFYYIDNFTGIQTLLPGKTFHSFSKDGTKAILFDKGSKPIYIFDNITKQFTDSLSYQNLQVTTGLFYDDVLKAFEVTILDNVTIKNYKTGQVLHNYQSKINFLELERLSFDQTKLYYKGGILNGGSMVIAMFDMNTGVEQIIAEAPYLAGGGIPMDEFVISDDNKKMAFLHATGIYIKNIP
jgi:hypothetical protein